MFEAFYQQLEVLGIVPVIVLEDEAHATPMAAALMGAGMRSAEITFRTEAAAASIRAMVDAQPEMMVGAGTVTTLEQVDSAVASGAAFIVAPNFDTEIVRRCIDLEVPVLPGCVTPTEVGAARKLGLTVTKFFPAAQYGGLATIKAISAPFVGHRFIPTGGVSMDNLEEYLSAPQIVACGGTWMVKPELFAEGDFSKVEKRAAKAMAVVHRVRG